MLQRVGNTAAAVHQEKVSQEDDLFMLFLELA